MNGNRGAQQQFSVSLKFSKEVVPFQNPQVRIPSLGVRCKNDSVGLLASESDEKIRVLIMFLRIRLQPKPPDSL